MPVARAKQEISSREFEGWAIYERLEPFGDDWKQAATIAAQVANQNATKESQLRKPEDFIPRYRVVGEQQQSDDEIENTLDALYG